MANWYVSSVKWSAVAAWTASTAYAVGALVRQAATPTVGSERVFRCTTAGTSLATEPAWTITKGGTTTEAGGPVWTEVTGQAVYNGDGGGSAWAAPHARLASALASTWGAAGDTIYVDGGASGVSPHAETQATTLTITPLGTAAAPQRIICVDNATVPPTTLATTATITVSGSNVSLTAGAAGFAYFYGVQFIVSNAVLLSTLMNIASGGSTGATATYFESCQFLNQNQSSTSTYGIRVGSGGGSGGQSSYVELKNCTLATNAVGNYIALGYGAIRLIGCTVIAGGSSIVPSPAFSGQPGCQGLAVLRDCDLSALSGSLISYSNASSTVIRLQNCRLNASATITGAPPAPGGPLFRLENSDSSATNYRYFLNAYGGTVQNETIIVRSGGDTDGTTALSWKVVTSANSKLLQPLELDEMVAWNTLTGSRTVTVEIASNATLTNADVWMEVEYPGSASYPQGRVVTTRLASPLPTASGAALASSSASWASSPGTAQKLVATIAPAAAGPIKARVFIGKASQTLYVDPVFTVT